MSAGLTRGVAPEPAAASPPAVAIRCAPMTPATKRDAETLLGEFLRGDDHYLASSPAYGDGGSAALVRALDLFLARPDLGFVWLAFADDAYGADGGKGALDAADTQGMQGTQVPEGTGGATAVGACVVCHAISTSRGTLVAKLDDVTIPRAWRNRGVGGAMLGTLAAYLRRRGITRVDCGCHRDNAGAWRFYERLGFRPLDEERIALLL